MVKPISFKEQIAIQKIDVEMERQKVLEQQRILQAAGRSFAEKSKNVVKPVFPVSDDVRKAMKEVGLLFPNIPNTLSFAVEQKIKQLLPPKMDVITNWTTGPIEQHAEYTTQLTKLTKFISDLNAYELLDEVVAAAKPKKFFEKLLSTNVDTIKGQVLSLKIQLQPCVQQLDTAQQNIAEMETKLSTGLMALAGVAQAVSVDEALKLAMHNKRTILSQCVMQSKLSLASVTELSKRVVDVMSKIEYINAVTIPAIEAAQK